MFISLNGDIEMSKKVSFFKYLNTLATNLGKIAKHLKPVFVLIPLIMGVFPHNYPERIQEASFCQVIVK